MTTLPNHIYSGAYKEGHVQGIAVDALRGYVYYSFTTMLLKTDLLGNPIGSVIRLAGHLGCITYDTEKDLIYGSLEIKHDAIGAGIISRIGYDATEETAFYLVAFDCKKINAPDMNAKTGGVMRAIYLSDVVKDYQATDEASGKTHRYGSSGIDGTGLGPIFGKDKTSQKKIMVAYGVYGDTERQDNDYQVTAPMCLSTTVGPSIHSSLTTAAPHTPITAISSTREIRPTAFKTWNTILIPKAGSRRSTPAKSPSLTTSVCSS